jgi:hypothetical protein
MGAILQRLVLRVLFDVATRIAEVLQTVTIDKSADSKQNELSGWKASVRT